MPLICFPSKMNASLIWRSHMKHENKKNRNFSSIQYRVTNINKYKITLKFEEVGAKMDFCVFLQA